MQTNGQKGQAKQNDPPINSVQAKAAQILESVPLPDPVQDVVQTTAALHARSEKHVTPHQRRVERFSYVIGRPASLYVVLALVAGWIGINLWLRANNKPAWDIPPFFWLQGFVGLAALLTALVVVITQRRQDIKAEQRAELDLQISLIIEQKATKLIALVEELRRDSPDVQDRTDPEAERMTEAADPQVMLVALEHMLNDAVDTVEEINEAAEAKANAQNQIMPSGQEPATQKPNSAL